jgi:hypothetical protein
MTQIPLFKIRSPQMDREKFAEMARFLEIDGKFLATDEALVVANRERALAFAQPCGKFAGLLFFTDQSRGIAEPIEKPVDTRDAEGFANEFLKRFDLLPKMRDDDRIKFSFEIGAHTTEAVTFDGKERQRTPLKTEISSRIHLNEVPVVGPRAKARMVFKDNARPIFVHFGMWESVEIYEERRLISKDEAVALTRGELTNHRPNGKEAPVPPDFEIVDVKLAYFATEYTGGPDLLAPFYFVEVEYEHQYDEQKGGQGPRQLLPLPAYR